MAATSLSLLSVTRTVPRMPDSVEWVLRIVVGGMLLGMASGCHQNQSRTGGPAHLDFNQDVQPILASRCFSCHGPDPEMRKAGLRLDLEESALRKRPGHPDAIVPGHPDQSELVKRIESRDPHHLMPQTAQGDAKPLKQEEIAILREWIQEGAVYRPHWAFEVPTLPKVPALPEGDNWARTPIDNFILAKMRSKDCGIRRKRTKRP